MSKGKPNKRQPKRGAARINSKKMAARERRARDLSRENVFPTEEEFLRL